jgi:hypothetical protein
MVNSGGFKMGIEQLSIREIIARLTAKQVWGLVIVIGTLISVPYTVGHYFAALRADVQIAQKDLEIQKLTQQWAYLEPQVALTRYFDLKKQVISVNDRHIPSRSVLIDNQFLARTDLPGLIYRKMTEPEWMKWSGMSPTALCQGKLPDLGPIHVWTGTPSYTLKRSREVVAKHSPEITVQKVMKAKLEDKLLALVKCLSQTAKETEPKSNKELSERLEKFASNIRRIDLVGLIYALIEFNGYVTAALNSDFDWTANVVEKQEGFLYGTVLNAQRNVEISVDGKALPAEVLYKRVQTVVVEVPYSIYLITISVPSITPTVDLAFSGISNQWLTDLRLFSN